MLSRPRGDLSSLNAGSGILQGLDDAMEEASKANHLSENDGSRALPSLGDVFKNNYAEVLRFVRSRVGAGPPDPDDIVQQAFAKFASHTSRDRVRNPTAFLIRVSSNLIKDHARKSATRFNVSVNGDEFDSISNVRDEISPEIVVLGRERLNAVLSALKKLPRRQRRFVLLNRIEGQGIKEIAAQNGVSQSTARREVENGVAACRQALTNLAGGHDG